MMSCGCRRPSALERRLPRALPPEMLKQALGDTKLTSSEVASLYNRFRQLAPNGEMTFAKFRNTMGMLGMLDDLFLPYRMFCAFDANEDAKLNFVEFAVALGIMIRGDDDAKLELAFRILTPTRSTRNLQRVQHAGSASAEGTLQRAVLSRSRVELSHRDSSSSILPAVAKVGTQELTHTKKNEKSETDKKEIDGLTLFEFQTVVASLESTRRQLIGGNVEPINEWQTGQIFRSVSSTRPDGTPYMTLNDFKKAVRTNTDFLCVLGIHPGTQDRHLNTSTRVLNRKQQEKRQDPPQQLTTPHNNNNKEATHLDVTSRHHPHIPTKLEANNNNNNNTATSSPPTSVLKLSIDGISDTTAGGEENNNQDAATLTTSSFVHGPTPLRQFCLQGHLAQDNNQLLYLKNQLLDLLTELKEATATYNKRQQSFRQKLIQTVPEGGSVSYQSPPQKRDSRLDDSVTAATVADNAGKLTNSCHDSPTKAAALLIQTTLNPLPDINLSSFVKGESNDKEVIEIESISGAGSLWETIATERKKLDDRFSRCCPGPPPPPLTSLQQQPVLFNHHHDESPRSLLFRNLPSCIIFLSNQMSSLKDKAADRRKSKSVCDDPCFHHHHHMDDWKMLPSVEEFGLSLRSRLPTVEVTSCHSNLRWSMCTATARLRQQQRDCCEKTDCHSPLTPTLTQRSQKRSSSGSSTSIEQQITLLFEQRNGPRPLAKSENTKAKQNGKNLNETSNQGKCKAKTVQCSANDKGCRQMSSQSAAATSFHKKNYSTDCINIKKNSHNKRHHDNLKLGGASQLLLCEDDHRPTRIDRQFEALSLLLAEKWTIIKDLSNSSMHFKERRSLSSDLSPHLNTNAHHHRMPNWRPPHIPPHSSLLLQTNEFFRYQKPSDFNPQEHHPLHSSSFSTFHSPLILQVQSRDFSDTLSPNKPPESTKNLQGGAMGQIDNALAPSNSQTSSPIELQTGHDTHPLLTTSPHKNVSITLIHDNAAVDDVLTAAKTRVTSLLHWIDKMLNEIQALSRQQIVLENLKKLGAEGKSTGFTSNQLASSPMTQFVGQPSIPSPAGSPDTSTVFASSTTGADVPRMFMNKPNFEQRRANKRQGSIAQLQQRIQRRRAEYKLLGPQKGFAVHFGHPSWNMVLNMMVGMRLAAGRINNEPKRKVEAYDFIMKEKISILPRSANTVETEAKENFVSCSKESGTAMEAVRFIDYAPMVFRKIREFFYINAQEYLWSVGPEQLVGNMVLGNLASLSELCSEGKSGAFFYYTADGRFLIKTITRDAAKFLQHILKDYYEHIVTTPDTLITRIYGYHAIRLKKESGNVGAKLYFIVMGNFFHTPFEIHRRYDLKGSWIGRSSGPNALTDPTIALKDADLVQMKEKIFVGAEKAKALKMVIEKDASFFQSHQILDYSLLIGIHFRPDTGSKDDNESGLLKYSSQNMTHHFLLEDSGIRRPFHQKEFGGMSSSDGTKIYYVGIIDILTKWTTFKKLEHDIKSLKKGTGAGISCVHPTIYAKRFVEFLKEHIE